MTIARDATRTCHHFRHSIPAAIERDTVMGSVASAKNTSKRDIIQLRQKAQLFRRSVTDRFARASQLSWTVRWRLSNETPPKWQIDHVIMPSAQRSLRTVPSRLNRHHFHRRLDRPPSDPSDGTYPIQTPSHLRQAATGDLGIE